MAPSYGVIGAVLSVMIGGPETSTCGTKYNRSVHRLAAANVVRLPGDRRCCGCGQKPYELRDLFGLNDPLDRNRAERNLAELLERLPRCRGTLTHPLGGHLGVDPARGDRIHGDLPRCQLQCERASEPDHAVLRRAVRGVAWHTEASEHRRQIDDPAAGRHE